MPSTLDRPRPKAVGAKRAISPRQRTMLTDYMIRDLIDKCDYTVRGLAKILGRTPSTISEAYHRAS